MASSGCARANAGSIWLDARQLMAERTHRKKKTEA
jgi:hypothetical protein